MEYQDAFVLFNEGKITSIQSIIPALEMANQVLNITSHFANRVKTDESFKLSLSYRVLVDSNLVGMDFFH